jgi:hypothetical protein
VTEPNNPTPGDYPPIQRPSGPLPPGSAPGDPQQAPQTRIIRRAPTGALPQITDDAQTIHIPRQPPPARSVAPTQHPAMGGTLAGAPSGKTAIAASAVSIVSGWATSVVATDLIAGWWKSDRLFCVAVAFLALIFALATISGVITLLLRRSVGRYLIVAGSVIALLTYGGVFIAGARVAWIVHTLPLLPVAGVVLALVPSTKDWVKED